jgi:hypothetical protein
MITKDKFKLPEAKDKVTKAVLKKRRPLLPGQTGVKGVKEALNSVKRTMAELHLLHVGKK